MAEPRGQKEPETILVTGATGFIGRELMEVLKERGQKVVGISRGGGSVAGQKAHAVDISDIAALKKFLKGKTFSQIYHLAAYVPNGKSEEELERCARVNVIGTRNLLECARMCGAKRFVYTSSYSVCNGKSRLGADESVMDPGNEYGVTKMVGELLCRRNGDPKMKVIILRFSSVYGPGQEPHFVLPRFMAQLKKCEEVVIWGDGKDSFDFLYVKDAAEAVVLAGSSTYEGVVNIGSGKETSVKRLAEDLVKMFPRAKIRFDRSKPSSGKRFCFDISRARKVLKFSPAYTLKAGLKEYKYHEELER
ncbi:MAG: NAD(P)-dependent oxidoreductase [Methanobacteriota archaeon]